MKAIRIHTHGDTGVLKFEELPHPEPQPGEILVRIRAVALNHLDLWVRKGLPGISLPIIPGSEASGIIEALGPGLPEDLPYQIGDPVIILPFRSCRLCEFCLAGEEELCPDYIIPGEHIDGMMVEFVNVPAAYIRKKPENLDFEHAAAYPLVFLTAYHMLISKVQIQPGDWVLVWGASSGVGHAAIQIAKHHGAKVISTAGSLKKEAFAIKFGSDFVVNYVNSDVVNEVNKITNGHGADIVFEHVGQNSWQDSLKLLARCGKIVTCGATTGPVVQINLRRLFIKHQQILGSTMGNLKEIDEITSLIENGILKPHVDKIFPMEKIIDAHEYLESGKHIGKVVVSFAE